MRYLAMSMGDRRGGVESCLMHVARGATARGWDVHAAFPPTDALAPFTRELESTGIACHPLDIRESDAQRLYWDHAGPTLELLERVRPDRVHVHINWALFALPVLMACSAWGAPTLATYHLGRDDRPPTPAKRDAASRLNPRVVTISAVSRHLGSLLERLFGYSAVEVVPNGVEPIAPGWDTLQRMRADARLSVREELQLAEAERVLLSVGRLDDQKDHARVVEALPAVVRAHPDVRCVWLGEGDLRPNLESRLSELGLRERVIIPGFREDVRRFLLAADVFVLPSKYEGLALSLLEAMAAGAPVVCSDASSNPETVEPPELGLTFPVGDAGALAARLVEALDHPAMMLARAERAFAKSRRMSLHACVERTLDLIERTPSDCA